jgi:hypothetical protein
MKILLSGVFTLCTALVYCQNIGIGTNTPRFPLSFSNSFGDKIVLWDDGNQQRNTYGIGVQDGSLQFHTYRETDNMMFGFGSSGIFYERMKLLNSGPDGLNLSGRIVLKNGTTNPADGAGIWFYDPNNTALVGFMGVQNAKNMGFYGGPLGWGLTYDVTNSNVGIGNNNPTAPLSFSSSYGKKISLYQGATGDAGLGTLTNQLQIFTDNPNGEVAIGYNSGNQFMKRFAFKANGTFEIQGSTGSQGQVLASNGSNTVATWQGLGNIIQSIESPQFSGVLYNTQSYPFNRDIVINTAVPAKVIVYYKPRTWKDCLFGDCHTKWTLKVYLDGVERKTYGIDGFINSGQYPRTIYSDHTIGPDVYDLAAGNHTISFTGINCLNEPYVVFNATAIVIPK